MQPQVKRQIRRLPFFITSAVLLVLIVIYGAVSLEGYNTLSLPRMEHSTATPTGEYQDVSFPSRGQSYQVYGFFIPAPGPQALISVPGYRVNRRDEYHLNRAAYLHNLGYNVLSIDLSDSGGDTVAQGRISMGFRERWDVLGAYDYLFSRGFAPERIGLVGESMGAATVLLASALDPRIRAIWADSPYTRADAEVSDQTESGGFSRIVVPGGMLWGVILSGDRIWEAAPIDAGPAIAANRQAVYLVHCVPDQRVYFHHSVDLNAAYNADGVDVTFWPVPDGGHTSALVNHRDEYLQRLNAFFKQHLA